MDEPTGLTQVEAEAMVVRGLVAGVDPDAVPLPEAPRMWEAFGIIARLAGAAQLLLARRIEESPAWKDKGCRSTAEYLARVSGGSVRGAQEVLRASKKIDEVPAVEAALRRGELSVVQAEMITDAASQDPTKQAELLDAAGRLSLAELGQQCGRIKAAADPHPEKTWERIRANRRLRQRTDGEGAWCFFGRGTPDDGALLRFALEPLIDEMFDQARQGGRHEHRDAYAYDALIELLRRSLDSEDDEDDVAIDETDDPERNEHADEIDGDDGWEATDDNGGIRVSGDGDGVRGDGSGHRGPDAADLTGGDGLRSATRQVSLDDEPLRSSDSGTDVLDGKRGWQGSSGSRQTTDSASRTTSTAGERRGESRTGSQRRPRTRRRRSRSNPRYLALLRVDVTALKRGHVEDGEVVEIAGIGPVPVGVARDVLGDAIVKLVITKGVDVGSVTHLGRQATAAQRVALLWQSPTCSNEACPHSFVQIDHREPWAQTHRTRLAALDPLCPHCHRLKTYEGWSLVDGVGKRAFVAPTDARHPNNTRTSNITNPSTLAGAVSRRPGDRVAA